MRNNTKKGFTLVELLVVIAILAILATVSVVGYTSFIERANVSADEQLVAQLNNFLEAYKVNNPEKIDEHNVREVTRDILELSGVEKLVPKSKNHFYFNLATGKYELKNDEDAAGSPLGAAVRFMAHAEGSTFKAMPGNCFTVGYQYYFVDTEGEIADVINSFYAYAGEGEFNEAAFEEFVASAGAVSNKFTALLNESVFVTNGGVYAVEGATQGNIFFHENEDLVIDKVLDIALEVSNGTVIPFELPSNISHIDTGSLNFTGAPAEYAGVLFTVDMTAEEFVDVIMYDEDLAKAKFEVSDGVAKMVNTPVDGADKYHLVIGDRTLDFDMNKHRPIQVKSDSITILGNGNPVKLSDLFHLRNGVTNIQPGTKLVIKNAAGKLVPSTSDVQGELLVNKAEHTLSVTTVDDVTSLTDLEFQFTNTSGQDEITIEIQNSNGVAIAEPVTVKVVNATNIRNYAGLTALMNASNQLSGSVVLLDTITMTSDKNYFEIPANTVFYGNTHTLNITAGRITEAGIINLSGKIQDTKVVGQVYTRFGMRVTSDYGSSAIYAQGGKSEIENCYVANCRSPLRLGGNTTVKDSVFFGGRYSNIDITAGILKIQGDVITVNQIYNYNGTDMLGTGITLWWSANPATAKVVIDDTNDGNLIQYNFISASDAKKMPMIGLVEMANEAGLTIPDTIAGFIKTCEDWGLGVGINLGDVFGNMITRDTYKSSTFNNGTVLNAGIVYLNKTTADSNIKEVDEDRTAEYDFLFVAKEHQSWPLYYITEWLCGELCGSKDFPVVINTYLNNVDANKDMYKDSADASTTYYFDNYEFENGQIIH